MRLCAFLLLKADWVAAFSSRKGALPALLESFGFVGFIGLEHKSVDPV
jgi:hypothetical protein